MKVPHFTKKYNTRSSQRQKNLAQQKSQVQGSNQNVCAACLFQISTTAQDYCSSQCKHHYHQKCLEEWLKQKNTCCLCRQKIQKYTSRSKGEVTVPQRTPRTFRFNLFSLLFPNQNFESNHNFPQIIFFDNTTTPFLFVNSQMSNFLYSSIEQNNDRVSNPRVNTSQLRTNLSSNSLQIINEPINSQTIIRPEVSQPRIRRTLRTPNRKLSKRKRSSRLQIKQKSKKTNKRHINKRNVTKQKASLKKQKGKNKKIEKRNLRSSRLI